MRNTKFQEFLPENISLNPISYGIFSPGLLQRVWGGNHKYMDGIDPRGEAPSCNGQFMSIYNEKPVADFLVTRLKLTESASDCKMTWTTPPNCTQCNSVLLLCSWSGSSPLSTYRAIVNVVKTKIDPQPRMMKL